MLNAADMTWNRRNIDKAQKEESEARRREREAMSVEERKKRPMDSIPARVLPPEESFQSGPKRKSKPTLEEKELQDTRDFFTSRTKPELVDEAMKQTKKIENLKTDIQILEEKFGAARRAILATSDALKKATVEYHLNKDSEGDKQAKFAVVVASLREKMDVAISSIQSYQAFDAEDLCLKTELKSLREEMKTMQAVVDDYDRLEEKLEQTERDLREAKLEEAGPPTVIVPADMTVVEAQDSVVKHYEKEMARIHAIHAAQIQQMQLENQRLAAENQTNGAILSSIRHMSGAAGGTAQTFIVQHPPRVARQNTYSDILARGGTQKRIQGISEALQRPPVPTFAMTIDAPPEEVCTANALTSDSGYKPQNSDAQLLADQFKSNAAFAETFGHGSSGLSSICGSNGTLSWLTLHQSNAPVADATPAHADRQASETSIRFAN